MLLNNNIRQIAGLETAQTEVVQNSAECSLIWQHHEKEAEKKLKVQYRERKLTKAKTQGRSASEIQKCADKPAEARWKLEEAEET
ncbi:DUF1090 family protein [Pantoea agglomerans]|uniref:DUF1090 family protein n=1 Tax=Enterobacter agglomerans TaxID=549 RepID=UPI003015948A